MLFQILQSYFNLDTVQKVTVSILPVIFAITVHEAAHGYAARHFGDMTAAAAGRISLNPLRHIDPFGTILLPLMTSLLGGVMFGWAKPVPVNFGRLRHPKRDMLWVAAAGPGSNLAMALLWVAAIKISMLLPSYAAVPLTYMGAAGVWINTILMVLNLFPLPPLDGGRIAVSLLPQPYAYKYAQIERYGFIILIVLLFTGILGKILWPLINVVIGLLSVIFNF